MRVFTAVLCILALTLTSSVADEADKSSDIISTCDSEGMQKYGIEVFDLAEEVRLCDMARRYIGQNLEAGEFRYLLKATYLTSRDGGGSAKEQEYQLLNIIDARGIGASPDKVKSNLDTIVKIYNGSDGRVAPKDLNVFLQNAGDLARTISDDGLISIAAMISIDKKKRGE